MRRQRRRDAGGLSAHRRGQVADSDASAFGALLDSLPTPVLAYCRSGARPSRLAWMLKEEVLPPIYWKAMLRGREWMAKPQPVTAA